MVSGRKPVFPDPFVFVPRQAAAQLLFILLHGESAGPQQMFPLADAIKQAFPLAAVVLPFGPQREAVAQPDLIARPEDGGYHWVDPEGLGHDNYTDRVSRALPPLIEHIQAIQARFGLSGQQTALAGFSQGASMALEASHSTPSLAGRVLAFSGLYASAPTTVPPSTLLHFFHGANDQQVSVNEVEVTLARLAELQGDATLDVASRIGHELHAALINQAIVRLQTCVPLRSWDEALSTLEQQSRDEVQALNEDNICEAPKAISRGGRTLH